MRRVPARFFISVALVVLLAACSGGKSDAGAETPERAVDAMLVSLTQGGREALQNVFEPERRKEPFSTQSFGPLARLMAPLWDGRQADSASVRDVSLSTNYQENKAFASVHVKGTLTSAGSDLALDQDVLVVQSGDRWYVTTWENAYWKDLRKQQVEREAQARDAAVAAFAAQLDSDLSLPGEYVAPHPGVDGRLCSERACLASMDDRRHVSDGINVPICSKDQVAQNKISDPFCYTSNPPTSGLHANAPAPFAVLRQPATKEALVHNMEHGGVVVWYNTANQAVIRQLEEIAGRELRAQRLVVLSPYREMEPDTIALTAWTRLDKFGVKDFSERRVEKFIRRHNKRFNPEGF